MGQLPEPDVTVQALRYFGLYPGVVRAEIKAPHISSLEEPIDSYIPSSLENVTDTEELIRQAVESVGSLARTARCAIDITSVFQSFQMLEERVRALKETFNSKLKSAFEPLREINLEEVTEKARVAGRELGERGWLVGPLMTPQGLFRVLEGNTDQIMKERYPANHLIEMVREPNDLSWQKTILEGIYSYRDGRYRVVILSILPVIEALVRERVQHRVDINEMGSVTEVNIEANKQTEARAEEEVFLLAASEASMVGFTKPRWDNTGPNILEADPSELSWIDRHWALHGADDPERWDPIDAHRLL